MTFWILQRKTSLLLATILLSSAAGCVKKANPSKIATTSDKLHEYGYVVEGSIELPLEESAYKTSHLFDLAVTAHEAGQSSEAASLKATIKDSQAFDENFQAKHAKAWPLIKNGAVDPARLKYWISRQLKFNQEAFKDYKVSTTLKDIRSVTTEIDASNKRIVAKYQAYLLGVKHLTEMGSNLNESPIKVGVGFEVPSNPISFFFDAAGADHLSWYQSQVSAFDSSSGLSAIEGKQLVEKTASIKNCLVPEEGHFLSPFNSFYYFKISTAGCAAPLASVRVVNVEDRPASTTFPEFHRLFDDNHVKVFVYYGMVDHEDLAASGFAYDLRHRGYVDVSDATSKNIRLKKDVNGINLEVELAVEKKSGHVTAREEFRRAIKEDEVVVYDGHAGYGANIDEAFTKADSFPKGKYQIFLLNGCNTYKYGMTQVIYTKSMADFDFHNLNVDVISTYESVNAHVQQEVLLALLEEAAEAYQKKDWNDARKKEFTNKFSWLAIVSAINKASDEASGKENGIFMVSGEEDNDYAPGKTAYSPADTLTEDQLSRMINDDTQDEQYRMNVLKALVRMKFDVTEGATLAGNVEKARAFCQEMKVKGLESLIFGNTFHLGSCQVKELKTSLREDNYQGMTIQSGSVRFHPNGKLLSAYVKGFITPEGIDIGTGTVLFHDNGRPARGYVKNSTTINGVQIDSGTTEWYADGKIRHLYSKNTVSANGVKVTGSIKYAQSGALLEGELVEAMDIMGVTAKVGSSIYFYEQGPVKRFEVSTDAYKKVLGTVFEVKGATIELYPNGKVRSVSGEYVENGQNHYEPTEILYNGEAAVSVSFREDGSMLLANGLKSLKNSPLPCLLGKPPGEESPPLFLFDRQGNLVMCTLREPFTLGGVSAPANVRVALESGRMRIIHGDSDLLALYVSLGGQTEDDEDDAWDALFEEE